MQALLQSVDLHSVRRTSAAHRQASCVDALPDDHARLVGRRYPGAPTAARMGSITGIDRRWLAAQPLPSAQGTGCLHLAERAPCELAEVLTGSGLAPALIGEGQGERG